MNFFFCFDLFRCFFLVQLLLRSGNRITKPHDYHCKCLQCHQKFKFDSLRHAQSRLNAYRGLASESYISLASIDPILTAFELGRELRDLSGKEKYFKVNKTTKKKEKNLNIIFI